jgi:hypothetical protein
MIFIFVMIVDFLAFSFGVFLFYRNNKVFKLRQGIIEKIYDHIDYEWRVEEFHKVSYNKMVLSFRRIRPESFYKDVSFIYGHREEAILSPFQV